MEVALGFIMFLMLWRMRDHDHAEGWLFGVYCVLAGIERFIIEFFRAKDDRFPWALGLSTAQLIAIGITIAGGLIMMARKRTSSDRPGIQRAGRCLGRPRLTAVARERGRGPGFDAAPLRSR